MVLKKSLKLIKQFTQLQTKMRVIIKPDYNNLADWVATYITETINKFNPTKEKPFVLGLPTGSTPLGIYKRLIELHKLNKISFKHVITFNMDEYVGLDKNHTASYYHYMHTHFFNHIDIPPENINLLDGTADNLQMECDNYETKIKKVGGINLFLCGVGSDGHLAFNEPGSSLSSNTRVKTLCKETIISNSRFFSQQPNEVPTMALTVGLNTIMNAKEVLVVVNGINKSLALRQCLEGSINNTWTISLLQTHNKAIVACDKASTRELKVKTVDYFNDLQLNTNIFGQPIINNLHKYLDNNDKIIVFSPHPDDDVIGMGGLLQFLNKQNVIVVYMTNGDGGYDHNTYTHNPRIQEATLALKVLGYNKKSIRFTKLPFYTNSPNRIITKEDTTIISTLLQDIKPNHIFVCNDSDPKKTHDRCYEIIKNSTLNPELKYVWNYNSAWGDWNTQTPNFIYYFNEQSLLLKLTSIKMHDSQDPPIVDNKNIKNFYDLVLYKNKSTKNPDYFQEEFLILTPSEFTALKNKI